MGPNFHLQTRVVPFNQLFLLLQSLLCIGFLLERTDSSTVAVSATRPLSVDLSCCSLVLMSRVVFCRFFHQKLGVRVSQFLHSNFAHARSTHVFSTPKAGLGLFKWPPEARNTDTLTQRAIVCAHIDN